MKHLLMIDDDDVIFYLFERTIQKFYPFIKKIDRCANGEEALTYFRERLLQPGDAALPDIAFLDVNMPVMGGFSFLECYANLLKDPNISPGQRPPSVVVLTTSLHDDDKKRALEFSKVKGYIVKPVTKEALESIFRMEKE